jgi:hypothetical protein
MIENVLRFFRSVPAWQVSFVSLTSAATRLRYHSAALLSTTFLKSFDLFNLISLHDCFRSMPYLSRCPYSALTMSERIAPSTAMSRILALGFRICKGKIKFL